MPPHECPRCRLLNTPNAERCDCGYELRLPASMQAADARGLVKGLGNRRVIGVMLLALEAVVWAFYFYNAHENNLLGIVLVALIPLSIAITVVALILLLSS